ncbi:nucleoporin Nup43 [Bacillus rossius redtenbacheri]|uniref:nucleoporin Nup43 n=1 Tax=Bacillus rossius redtenbacheri TaxID=93214 RepID=UPI002FDCCB6E
MGEVDKLCALFVGEKVFKVRWRPENIVGLDSQYFITGSWDFTENFLTVWKHSSDMDDPQQLSSIPHEGDVTELKFINDNACVASSSLGCVKLFSLDVTEENSAQLKEHTTWEKLHSIRCMTECPCTGLACFEEDIVTISEDGTLALLTAKRAIPVQKIDNADAVSLSCICFLKHNQVLTGNRVGGMKIWDFAGASQAPAAMFSLSSGQVGASCVAHHPTQSHIVFCGGEDGSVTVWDLRQNTFPVNVLKAHDGTVTELQFHPERPVHMFTSSTSGEIWNWDMSNLTGRPAPLRSGLTGDENPWLGGDSVKHRLEIYSVMPRLHQPVNSFDLSGSKIVFSSDNEAIYVCKDVIT